MTQASDAARAYSRANGDKFLKNLRDAAHPQPQRRPGPRRRHPPHGRVAGDTPVRPGPGQGRDHGDGRPSRGLRRVAGRRAGQAHRAGLRPLRRGAGRAGRRLGQRSLRAGGQGRQDLRSRRHRRQGPALRARQGAGVVPQNRRRGPGQRQAAARGRGGGLVAQPEALHRRAPGDAAGRRGRDQRHLHAQHRGAGHPAQPARHDLHRGRGARPARGPAQRAVGRRGA